MKGFCVIVLAFLFLFALACHPAQNQRTTFENQPSCLLKKGWIGFDAKKNSSGEIEVIQITPGAPAQKSDIREGDILVSIGGGAFYDLDAISNFMKEIGTEDPIPIVIKRNGQIINKQASPKIIYLPHCLQAVTDIAKKEKLNLVIVVNEVSNATGPPNEEWKRGIKNELRSEIESSLAPGLQYNDNFSIVEREVTEKLLKEIEMRQTGLVSGFKQFSSMIGATHILIIDFSRFPPHGQSSKYTDVVTRRLVEIDSGKTIASERCFTEY
jgi:hypothetical protein